VLIIIAAVLWGTVGVATRALYELLSLIHISEPTRH